MLCQYEVERRENIERNNEMLRRMGLGGGNCKL